MALNHDTRHHAEAEPQVMAWRCPACGIENVSDFRYGCPSCGGGKPGYKAPQEEPPDRLRETSPAAPSVPNGGDSGAFKAWWDKVGRSGFHDHEEEEIVRMAFTAGIAYARNQIDGRLQSLADSDQPTSGSVKNRTLIAALQIFLDQVYVVGEPEEVKSGEWLSKADIRNLIRELEGQEDGL